METPKKKRRVITLEDKKKVIEASEGKSSRELSKQFNMAQSTIMGILKEKASTLNAIDEGGEAKRTRLQPVKHEKIDEGVLRWIKSVRSQNVAVTGPLVMEKALKLAEHLGVEDFKASEGWLEKFKHRHSIRFRSNQGEAGEINIESLGNLQQEILQAEISKFSPDDVFNASWAK